MNKNRKTLNNLLKALEIAVIVDCVLAGLFFLLMVAFPRGIWVELFK